MNASARLSQLRDIDRETEAAEAKLRHLKKKIFDAEAKLIGIRHEIRKHEIQAMVANEIAGARISGRKDPL